MVTFSVSWFPLLYIEIIVVEDSGTVYLVSIIINISALFCGMGIMFKLLRKMSLDAIEQMYEVCDEFPDDSLAQTISNFENDLANSSRQDRPSSNFGSRSTPKQSLGEACFNTSADTSIQEKQDDSLYMSLKFTNSNPADDSKQSVP